MNKNKTLFSAKAIACFFVICLHIGIPSKYGQLVINFARFAVPLFFIITGYFTEYKNKKEMSIKLDNRIKKLEKLIIISFVFYWFLYILLQIKNGTLLLYLKDAFMFKNILKFLIFNWTTPLIGVGHLWYLFALLYVMYLMKFINKYNLYKQGYIYSMIVIVCIFIWELIDSYFNLNVSQIYYRNAWFMGLPFFMLGNFIKKHENRFNILNKNLIIYSVSIIFFIAILMYIEPKIISGDNCLFLSNILTNIFIFLIAINKKSINILSNIGEKYSGSIYIIHYAVIGVINMLLNINKIFLPIIVFTISYLLSLIYTKIKYTYFQKEKVFKTT